jgi:hypothetical protein
MVGFNGYEFVTGLVANRQVHSLPMFELNKGRMQALCSKPVQEQPIAGLERRKRINGCLLFTRLT